MKNLFFITLCLFLLKSYGICDLRKTVDLTWAFESNRTITWSGVKPFQYTKRVADEDRGYWYAANEFCLGEHGGTHIDAPYHFYKYGWKVADIPIERLIAKGVVIDLKKEMNENATTNLEVKHLMKWEKENGHFEKGSVLLIKFGRSEYWFNSTKYFEFDGQNKMNFPGVSEDAAEWLVNSDKFYGVGLDTPSVDPGASTDFTTHKILNGKQIYLLENVKLIEELPAKGFTLVVMPMKLKEGSGAPVRIVAVPRKIFDD